MSDKVESVLLQGHTENCRCVGDWVCPETKYLTRDHVSADTNSLIVFSCNDPECNAQLAFTHPDVRRALGIPTKSESERGGVR